VEGAASAIEVVGTPYRAPRANAAQRLPAAAGRTRLGSVRCVCERFLDFSDESVSITS
jgi:hypothetical protein